VLNNNRLKNEKINIKIREKHESILPELFERGFNGLTRIVYIEMIR
jgi:hypothetical protein